MALRMHPSVRYFLSLFFPLLHFASIALYHITLLIDDNELRNLTSHSFSIKIIMSEKKEKVNRVLSR